MASEEDSLSEEASSSCCWSPPEGSPSDGGEACKLFIHGLARTVTDDDLVPLFAPFGPIYTCVAIGKKGTSRRFGFAKFVDRASAADALEALRGTELKGKLLDLKFAVALGEPGPASGVQPKLLAKQRAAASQEDESPRIAARQLQLGRATSTSSEAEAGRPMPQFRPMQLPLAAAATGTVPALRQQALDVQNASPSHPDTVAGVADLATMAAVAGAPAVPAHLPDAPPPMHHLLIVPHGPGLSHDAVVQLVWYFRPLQISSNVDVPGQEKSSVLFSTLQQAHAALDAVTQRAAVEGHMPAFHLVSIPLHGQQVAALPAAPPLLLDAVPAGPQFMPAPVQQQQQYQQAQTLSAAPPGPAVRPPQLVALPAVPLAPLPAPCGLPPRPLSQQHQMSSAQQQREAVTMRPLYAGPRPAHLRTMHMLPPGYHPAYPPPPHCWAPPVPSQPPCPAAAPHTAPAPPRPPTAPPFNFLGPHLGPPGRDDWPSAVGGQQPPPVPATGACRHVGAVPCLPDSLVGRDGVPPSPKRLNPAAATFCPGQPGLPAQAAEPEASAPQAAVAAQVQRLVSAGPPVAMPPVIHSIFSNIEAALAGRSFVPAWDRGAPDEGQPLVVAEALDGDSGTEDEGEEELDPREVYAAVDAWNLSTCFVARALMRKLAPVEMLLKQTAVGDDPSTAAPSVLAGAVVRLLVDKAYKLRQVQSTYVKPDTGRLMLVLHDVSSPIPAEHISNTCPLLGNAAPAAEAELLELQAKLAFHGRRLYRHEVAAAAWRLQFAEHWAAEQGGARSDELRLAAAHLRGMLEDEDEIRWRRSGVHGLDLAQETAAISAAFRLPWTAAANWMSQRSPGGKMVPASVLGASPGSAEGSNTTGEYETRAILGSHEVLAPTVGIHMAPSRTACRSLESSIADPGAHERFIAVALAAHAASTPAEQADTCTKCDACSAAGSASAAAPSFAATPGTGQAGTSAAPQAASSGGASSEGVDPELEQSLSEADQLLAEAASFGADEAGADWPPLPAFFTGSPRPASPRSAGKARTGPASPSSGQKHAIGTENSSRQGSVAPVAGNRPCTTKAAGPLQRTASARILAVLRPRT